MTSRGKRWRHLTGLLVPLNSHTECSRSACACEEHAGADVRAQILDLSRGESLEAFTHSATGLKTLGEWVNDASTSEDASVKCCTSARYPIDNGSRTGQRKSGSPSAGLCRGSPWLGTLRHYHKASREHQAGLRSSAASMKRVQCSAATQLMVSAQQACAGL